MIVIESNTPIYFDCDQTLVLWDFPENERINTIEIPCEDWTIVLLPHKRHIKLLKDFKSKGHKICVWSGSGWEWSKKVVEILQLEAFVDIVMCKPKYYVDDLSCEEFMGKPLYYKQENI
jgi:hypothetical protein